MIPNLKIMVYFPKTSHSMKGNSSFLAAHQLFDQNFHIFQPSQNAAAVAALEKNQSVELVERSAKEKTTSFQLERSKQIK